MKKVIERATGAWRMMPDEYQCLPTEVEKQVVLESGVEAPEPAPAPEPMPEPEPDVEEGEPESEEEES
jgi:hypothetical protein